MAGVARLRMHGEDRLTEVVRRAADHICRRFMEEPYASRLPRDWYGETPAELVTNRPAEEIREFFEKYDPP